MALEISSPDGRITLYKEGWLIGADGNVFSYALCRSTNIVRINESGFEASGHEFQIANRNNEIIVRRYIEKSDVDLWYAFAHSFQKQILKAHLELSAPEQRADINRQLQEADIEL